MRILTRTEQNEPATAASRTFDFEKKLAAAVSTAIKPLKQRLREYLAAEAEHRAACARWSADAFDAKLADIRQRAMRGDETAAAELENGSLPARESYAAMEAQCVANFEGWKTRARFIFRDVREAIAPALPPVLEQAQAHLDAQLDALGVPRFRLIGNENRIGFILLQCDLAANGPDGADLSWLWPNI